MRRSWAEVLWGTGPVDVRGLKIVEPEEGDPLFLILDGALADAVDQVRGSNQHAVGEHRSPRLGEELVHVALGDPIGRVVRLGLDRPQVSTAVLSDQVNTGVDTPSPGPLIPQPNAAKFMLVDRIVSQEPLTDVLELLALNAVVRIELIEQVSECPHTRGC